MKQPAAERSAAKRSATKLATKRPPTKPATKRPATKPTASRLRTYAEKRDFQVTSEPKPTTARRALGQPLTFMVHKHHASRLHYDLRLEIEGVLASWAVPKGPSYDPSVKRLAVETEDHPFDYGSFEGRIPDGEYGAGLSLIWDRGTYDTDPPGQAAAQKKKGHLKFRLEGEKLKGAWHLVRTRPDRGGKSSWLLFKVRDEAADPRFDVVAERPESVVSGQTGPASGSGPRGRQTARVNRRARSTAQPMGEAGSASTAKVSAEDPQESSTVAPAVKLTHPERVVYPRDGITKRDIAAYFEAVSAPLLAAVAGRPTALERWPRGVGAPSWFQQDIGRDRQSWMHVVDTPGTSTGRTVQHLVLDSPASLAWLAQASALTFHIWSSRENSLSSPDWVIFDLDPAEGKSIEQTIEPALLLRELLDEMGLTSIPKTSGKRGLHLLVPIAPGHTYEQTLAFAQAVGETVTRQLPEVTVERMKSERRGRLYLDCMQNGYGKLLVAPYALRAVGGAPVSTPLAWNEVGPKLDPGRYNLRTLPARLDQVGDLFAPALKGRGQLPETPK